MEDFAAFMADYIEWLRTPKSRWYNFGPENIRNLADSPAVYVIYVSGTPVYIGSSCTLRSRLKAHRIGRMARGFRACRFGGPDEVTIKISWSDRYGEELMRERRLIRRLRPAFNLQGKAVRDAQ